MLPEQKQIKQTVDRNQVRRPERSSIQLVFNQIESASNLWTKTEQDFTEFPVRHSKQTPGPNTVQHIARRTAAQRLQFVIIEM